MLSRLKVRTKLLVTLLPLLLAIGVLAGLGVNDRLDQRGDAQRTVDYLGAARASATLVADLQTERLLYAALQNGYAPAAALVDKAKTVTDADAGRLRAELNTLKGAGGDVEGDTPAQVAVAMGEQIDAIEGARNSYNPSSGSAATVVGTYSGITTSLIGSEADLVSASTGIDGTGRALHWLSAATESDARTAADVTTVIATTQNHRLSDAAPALSDIPGLQSDATNAIKVFSTDSSQSGRQVLDDVLSDSRYSASQADWTSLGSIDPQVGLDFPMGTFVSIAQGRVDALREGEAKIFDSQLNSAISRSDSLERQVRLYLGGSASALLLALLLAATVTRAITTSLGRLTKAAKVIADDQLPKLVDSLKHPDAEHSFHATEIDLHSQDEFADLAAAFNAVEQTALDVAAEQVATLRKGISDLFVNLARRNQSLLDRQIEFIDRLEANEEDPDQLENLFKLDHLATRMRRNAESLLVLAGAGAPRRRTKEVSLTDVIRVAVGEVEDFSRITLLAVDEANAIGSAAVDVAHLLSELMENGTQYSPPDRRVEVVGHRTNDGGYVVSVSDQGIGMEPAAMAEANQMLARPPAVGLSLSRSLGFVVIATLAHRHSITVRLTEAPSGGVAALVTLPPHLLLHAEAPLTAMPADMPRSQVVGEAGLAAAITSTPTNEDHFDSPAPLPEVFGDEWDEPAASPFIHHRAEDAPGEVDVPFEETASPWTDEHTATEWTTSPFGLEEDPFAAFAETPAPVEDLALEGAFESFEPVAEVNVEPAIEPHLEAYETSEPAFDASVEPFEPPYERTEPLDDAPVAFGGIEPVEHAESFAPAASMEDALPMGLAFEQGLFALLDHPDGQRADTPPADHAPPTPEPAPPASPFIDPMPIADRLPPLLGDPEPAGRPDDAAWADPSEVLPAMPPPIPTPPIAPLLPQRRPTAPLAAGPGGPDNAERIGSPSRPPEEIRSILSRYRSGLQTGRTETADVADPPTDPTFPENH